MLFYLLFYRCYFICYFIYYFICYFIILFVLFYAVIILGEEENKKLFHSLVLPTFFDATLLYIGHVYVFDVGANVKIIFGATSLPVSRADRSESDIEIYLKLTRGCITRLSPGYDCCKRRRREAAKSGRAEKRGGIGGGGKGRETRLHLCTPGIVCLLHTDTHAHERS